MKLLALDRPELIALAAGWLGRKENYQWLDFGNGRQALTPELLRIMTQQSAHFLRVYTAELDDTPIGIVGLNSIHRGLGTATFWGASGDKAFRHRGCSTLASLKLLDLAFRELGLHAINTWAVEHNPSLRTIERLGFRFVGRQRQCHLIDGRLYDRLLFDLLAGELPRADEARGRRAARAQRHAVDRVREAQAG